MQKRTLGVVVRGLRGPIIHEGDDVAQLVTDTLLNAAEQAKFEIMDKDVLGITESVVARAQGNYATVDDIVRDVQEKFPGVTHLGLIFPILSRNRFSICLHAFARAMDKITLMLSYPSDEVGNQLISDVSLRDSGVNPWTECLDEATFRETFGYQLHPFTGVDYIELYREICESENCELEVLFSNRARKILDYVPNVITCDIHTRYVTLAKLLEDPRSEIVKGFFQILNTKSDDHGYNEEHGLLGSNLATPESIKLFPRDSSELVNKIQHKVKDITGQTIEVMIYGDGAFKDPVGKIWELADPVVSPAYTPGLEGSPDEVKLKYLADSHGQKLSKDDEEKFIREMIQAQHKNSAGDALSSEEEAARLGTTPRRLTDLLGSLCDLASGSGDKGTPFIYIQGYFDNYASE